MLVGFFFRVRAGDSMAGVAFLAFRINCCTHKYNPFRPLQNRLHSFINCFFYAFLMVRLPKFNNNFDRIGSDSDGKQKHQLFLFNAELRFHLFHFNWALVILSAFAIIIIIWILFNSFVLAQWKRFFVQHFVISHLAPSLLSCCVTVFGVLREFRQYTNQ